MSRVRDEILSRRFMKLLAVGDLHLGKRPSRLPEGLAVAHSDLGPSAAWSGLVEAALEEGVDAVLLAGDVVESAADFFEAWRDLHQGVERLAAKGIAVLGVSGNHDTAVLPRLAAQVKDFVLLGAQGSWECRDIEVGGERVALWGWSFTSDRARESPLAGVAFERRPGLNIGILHADRDQPGSAYAPVGSSELEAAGFDAWLLGHIHKPDDLAPPNPSGYLGSVAGTDPGEPGPRGPWLLTVEAGRIAGMEQWRLAPLRWERLEVDAAGIEEPTEIQERLLEAVRRWDEGLAEERWPPRAVGLRAQLRGRTRLGPEARELLAEEPGIVHTGGRGTDYFLERVLDKTEPEIPFEELLHRTDPAGLLARHLAVLRGDPADPERIGLLRCARERLRPVAESQHWRALGGDPLSDEEIARHLEASGTELLGRMLAQRKEAEP